MSPKGLDEEHIEELKREREREEIYDEGFSAGYKAGFQRAIDLLEEECGSWHDIDGYDALQFLKEALIKEVEV